MCLSKHDQHTHAHARLVCLGVYSAQEEEEEEEEEMEEEEDARC